MTSGPESTINTVGDVTGGSVGINHGTINVFGSAVAAEDHRALADSVARYVSPIRHAAILGDSIPRGEARQVIARLEGGEKRGVLVVGEAGVGKSGVIAQVVAHFTDAVWPIVALRLDRMEPARDVRALGEALRLSDSPTAALLSVAKGRPCLVVIDQLDAVSATSGRHPDFFDRVGDLGADVRAHSNLRLLMGCRAFDLNEDRRIRRLVDAKRGIAEKVEVHALDDDVVRRVVQRAGRDPKALTDQQLRLLSLPFNLWVWTTVAEDEDEGDDLGGVDSARALLDRYWDQQSRRLDNNHPGGPGHWLGCLDALLDYMGDNRVPSAPLRRFQDEHRAALDALRSEHVLVSDQSSGARLAFPHETIFDYLFARRFIARERGLLDLLRAREQSLFLRTTVRQVLQHMRSGDGEVNAYIDALRDLLTADDVRFHIKEAVLAWLGNLDDPTAEEWRVLHERIAAAPEVEAWQWERRTMSGPWFDLLSRLGHIVEALNSGDPQQIDTAVRRLAGVADSRPDAVCEAVAGWVDRGPEWQARLLQVMRAGRARDSEQWVELFFRVADLPGVLDELGPSKSRFFEGLIEKRPRATFAIVEASLWASLREWSRQGAGLRKPFKRTLPSLGLLRFDRKWSWNRLAEVDPAAYCTRILPMVLETARLASRRYFVRPERPLPEQWIWWVIGSNESTDRPRSDWIWLSPSIDRQSFQWPIVWAAETAIDRLRSTDAVAHAETIALLLQYSRWATPAYLLLRALKGIAADDADAAVTILLDNPRLLRLGYSSATHWVAREVLEVAGPGCSDRVYAKLESFLLDYSMAYERRSWSPNRGTWIDRSGRIRWRPYLALLGRGRFVLLEALPKDRISANARRQLGELRRRFDRDAPAGPAGIRGGAVGPPFSARWASISDEQWLRAIRRHDRSDVDRAGDDFLKGGARELARQLEDRVKAEPARFAELFIALPKDINPVYADAILRGLASSAKQDGTPATAAEAVWAVIRHGFALPERPCGRWSWDLIVAYADAAVPEDILDIVAWYATQHPDPDPDDRATMIRLPGDTEWRYTPDTHGLNSVRGGMCWAIEALLFADPSRLERFRPAIMALIDDSSLAVRTQVPHALLPMLNVDADAAVEGILRLCAAENEVVATLPIAQHFLRHATRTHLGMLEPFLDSMLQSEYSDVRQNAAEWFASACYREQREPELMDELWRTGDEWIRRGLVEVACEVAALTDHPRHGRALSILARGFNAEDESVVAAAAQSFWTIGQAQEDRAVSLVALSPLFDAFIDSPAFEEKFGDLMFLLRESGTRMPDVALHAFERVLKVGTVKGHFDTGLIYRLYEDTKDEEVRRRCLDLIDGLLRRGDYDLQRTLASLDADSIN